MPDTRFPLLAIEKPLPSLDGYPINADFGNVMIELILTRQPQMILELGSGVSTLLMGYCLQKIGQGKVITLEHSPDYLIKTEAQIHFHQLESVVELIHAPLADYQIDGIGQRWYTMEKIQDCPPFDMVLVDGPPGNTQVQARYPALPLLRPYLSEKAILLCDDANRTDEIAMLERWLKQYPEWKSQYYPTESGAFLLSRR